MQNDKESLAELHQYLNDTSADAPPISPLEFTARPTLTKAERRRSLPARTSMASLASIASASPRVFSTQVPISSSFVRRSRIASSSSRAICNGHHVAPAAMISWIVDGCGPDGALTVIAARRAARSRRP